MTEIEILEKIDRRLVRLERIMLKPAKKTFVKVSIVQELTGWNAAFLRKARENGLVQYREEDRKFSYLLESIDEKFIKKAVL